jgi:hypothetical protein
MQRTYLLLPVVISVAIYFSLSLYFLPQAYLTQPQVKPLPIITDVSVSAPEIKLGESFTVRIVGRNGGESADLQTVSVAFPNITRTDGIVFVREHDFPQKPRFIGIGYEIGSAYMGLEKIVHARYPSIEFFSRPWLSNDSHHAEIEVRPDEAGIFVILVKSVALPHTDDSHYPREGITDHQGEHVSVYSVDVTANSAK